MLNEMDGVGVRVGASKETKRVAAAAECNAGAPESDDVSGSEVKVGSDHTRTNNHACMRHYTYVFPSLAKGRKVSISYFTTRPA